MGKMNFIQRPNKRMRLDSQNNFDVNVLNEDLWGEDDITADEFDMLEVQATQGTSGVNSSTFRQPLSKTSADNEISIQIESARQEQYELEGKVKILNDSLEMLKKELLEEKKKKEALAAEKAQEIKDKEKSFQKEMEKMKSSLQFKDQEMKAVYDKVKILESQLKENKIGQTMSTSKSPNKFLEKFNFQSGACAFTSENRHQVNSREWQKKYRLSIDSTKGKIPGSDIVSSILCNRLFPPQLSTSEVQNSPIVTDVIDKQSRLSALSIARINLEYGSGEIFHHSYCILKNFMSFLQSSKDQTVSNSKSSGSFQKQEVYCDKNYVISSLKDLSYIISCPQFSSLLCCLDFEEKMKIENKKVPAKIKDSVKTPSTSTLLECDKKQDVPHIENPSLLQLLFNLSNPNTYPSNYSKDEEIEWSLSALVSWSTSDPKRFLEFLDDQLVSKHVSNCFNITTSYMTLRILINLCTHKEYLSKLFHTDSCHLCSVATLLHCKITESPSECIQVMMLVEDFLSTVFTLYSFAEMKMENAPCSLTVLRAVLSSLLKFYEIRREGCNVTLILKKGFALLHLLSRCFPDFKNRRADFESNYISLVSAMLALSKENPVFKDFYDIAHELWDFQEDMSEFDLEDSSDDSTQTMNIKSSNDN